MYSGPIPPPFLTQWAYTPSFTYTVGTTLVIYCTQTVQPQSLTYLHSEPLSPHFMTQWAYTPHLLTQWAPSSTSTVHRLSNLTSSLTCTVDPYLLILWHSGHIPPHFLTQWAPSSPSTVLRLSSLSSSHTNDSFLSRKYI